MKNRKRDYRADLSSINDAINCKSSNRNHNENGNGKGSENRRENSSENRRENSSENRRESTRENSSASEIGSDIKAIFTGDIIIPDNVEASINIAYDNIYNMTDEELISEKADRSRNIFGRLADRISGFGIARMSLIAAVCMIVVATMVFREQIIKAAYEGYAYIYGHGAVKVEEEDFAYMYCGDNVVLGENGEMTVKFLYWYKNELTVFTRNLGVVNENQSAPLYDENGFLQPSLYINNDKENEWCVATSTYGSMTSYKYETGIDANGKIKLTAFGDSVELELEKQDNNKDMSDVINVETSYGSLSVYPVNSQKTVYFYQTNADIFSDKAYIDDSSGTYWQIELYDGDDKVGPRSFVSIGKMIVVDDDVSFDRIKFSNGTIIAMYGAGDDEGFKTEDSEYERVNFTVPVLKDGESKKLNRHLSVDNWDFEVVSARREGDEYMITLSSEAFQCGTFNFDDLREKGGVLRVDICSEDGEAFDFGARGSSLTGTGETEYQFSIGEEYDSLDKEEILMGIHWIEYEMENVEVSFNK